METQIGIEDRLVGDSECLRNNLLSLQIDAKYGGVGKYVAASVAVTLGKLGGKLLKTQGKLR